MNASVVSFWMSVTAVLMPSRIDILCRQKDQQLEDLVALKDERSSIAQGMVELNERIQLTSVRCQQLVRR